MRTVTCLSALMLLICAPLYAQGESNPKVFISVDMEGITGITNWEETSRSGKDYDYFRRIMSQEASAAVEGAVAAGASEVWVRDSHGSARNILPDLLPKDAKLLRDWSGGPKSMMEGIDESFDAVVFIGYHAKAGTPDALLEHTMTGNVTDVAINGVSLPEAGINGLIAGTYDVPVVFVSGDSAICQQAKSLFGEVETVAVKEGIGGAALNLHPEVAQEKIREGVEKAVRNVSVYKPYKLTSPYRLVVRLKDEKSVYSAAFYPGVERTGDWELTFESDDMMEVIKAFEFMIN
jgi:D-amino peptidase